MRAIDAVRARARDGRGDERGVARRRRPCPVSGDARVAPPLRPRVSALLHAQQEDVDTARPSLERRSTALAGADGRDARHGAAALAEVAIREGRTDEALGLLDEAEALGSGRPGDSRTRAARRSRASGDGRRRPSRSAQAALASPLDDALWSHLAVAYGSADQPADALDAARARPRARLRATPTCCASRPSRLERLGARRTDVAARTRCVRAVATARRCPRRQERLLAAIPVVRARAAARSTSTRCDRPDGSTRPAPDAAMTVGVGRRPTLVVRVSASRLPPGRGRMVPLGSRRADARAAASAGPRSRGASPRSCSRPPGRARRSRRSSSAIDRLVREPPTPPSASARASSTSRRSRRSRSTSSATCARPSRASPRRGAAPGVAAPRAHRRRPHRRHAGQATARAWRARPADILITTPESLYLLLTSAARETLAAVETVIVDEIHALVPTQARRAPGPVARAARGAPRARRAAPPAHRPERDAAPARRGRAPARRLRRRRAAPGDHRRRRRAQAARARRRGDVARPGRRRASAVAEEPTATRARASWPRVHAARRRARARAPVDDRLREQPPARRAPRRGGQRHRRARSSRSRTTGRSRARSARPSRSA